MTAPWQAPAPPAPPSGGVPRGVALAMLAALAVLVLVACSLLGVVGYRQLRKDTPAADPVPPPPAASVTAEPSDEPSQAPSPRITSASPVPPPSGDPAKPTLKSVPAVSIAGPTWKSGETTYTHSLPLVPVAFRTPEDWGCMASTTSVPPGATGKFCMDEKPTGSGRGSLRVFVRPCPGSCTAAEKVELTKDWDLAESWDLRARDGSTDWEERSNSDGTYGMVVLHYFQVGGKWYQVGMAGLAPPGVSRPEIQRPINDIRSQTP